MRFDVLGHVGANAVSLKFVICDLRRQLRPRVYVVLKSQVHSLGVYERLRHLFRVHRLGFGFGISQILQIEPAVLSQFKSYQNPKP